MRFYFFFISFSSIFIILLLYNFCMIKRKIIINEIIFSGLCNRLLGISSCFILSQISERDLLCIFLYQ